MLRILAACSLALATTGCMAILPEASRVDIQQGNILEPDAIAAVEEGMSRADVRARLGTPILDPSFNADRWDYVYYTTEAAREAGDVQRLSVHFDGDQVARVVDRYQAPDDPDPEEIPDVPEEEPEQPAPGGGDDGGGGSPSPSPSPSPTPGPSPGATPG